MSDEQKKKQTKSKAFAVVATSNEDVTTLTKLPGVNTTAQAIVKVVESDDFPAGYRYMIVQVCSELMTKREVTTAVLE